MEQEDLQKVRIKEGYSSHVRLTTDEYERITNESKITGKSIPSLLKETFFRGQVLSPLMTKEDQKVVVVQLSRIGNNINQIARKVNSGILQGFNDEIQEVQRLFSLLLTFLTSTYGDKALEKME